MVYESITVDVIVSDGQSTKPLGRFNFPSSTTDSFRRSQNVYTVPGVGHILNHEGLRFRVTSVEWALENDWGRISRPTKLHVEPIYEKEQP